MMRECRLAAIWVLLAALLAGCTSNTPLARLRKTVNKYAPTVLDADRSKLPPSERYALDKIIDAARHLDAVFYRQAYAKNPEIHARLAEDGSEEGRLRRLCFEMMKGPWDREDEWRPFATSEKHPKGAGFYPTDMTEEEFKTACDESPERAARLKSLVTLVRRDAGGRLVTVPYSKAFAEWLEPAATALEAAAELTRNESLKKFLRSRAAAFRSDDYYESDKDWMDLDSVVEVTIGPYEVYEDLLFGYKASFEAFVTIADPRASRTLDRYKSELLAMEQALPVPDAYKATRGRESPIRVVDLVYASGDARTSVQTLAFVLPNDERVRREKGSKKVLMANVIREKFRQILIPIGQEILDRSQVDALSSDAFFNQTLFHELSHSMGPTLVGGRKEGGDIRLALADTYSAIEEAKADVMGACNVLYQIRKGTFPADYRIKHLTSYFVGLFRSVRFGLETAHGKGAALQINSFLERGAATWDPRARRLEIDYDRLEKAIAEVLTEILEVQFKGDRAAARKMLDERSFISPVIKAAVAEVEDVPVDLRPIYPAAGERP